MLLFDFFLFHQIHYCAVKIIKIRYQKAKKRKKKDSAAARRNGKKTPMHFCTGVRKVIRGSLVIRHCSTDSEQRSLLGLWNSMPGVEFL